MAFATKVPNKIDYVEIDGSMELHGTKIQD